MSTIESIADNFIEKWCGADQDQDDYKVDLIKMIAEIHKEYIIVSIANEVCGKNLHSQFSSVMKEFRDIRNEISNLKTVTHVKETHSAVGASKLGPFCSKAALDYAKENNIDHNTVVGSGKDGKITKSDLSKVLKKTGSTRQESSKFCNGATNNGSPCKSAGKVMIKGKWYCKRHEKQGQKFENVDELDTDEAYDTNKEAVDRFRNDSIKSMESIDDSDVKLNDIIGDESEVDEVEESEDDYE